MSTTVGGHPPVAMKLVKRIRPSADSPAPTVKEALETPQKLSFGLPGELLNGKSV